MNKSQSTKELIKRLNQRKSHLESLIEKSKNKNFSFSAESFALRKSNIELIEEIKKWVKELF